MNKKELTLFIVGGCFPVQDNISQEKLYHTLLRSEIRKIYGQLLNVEVIRYERFSDCLNKINVANTVTSADILLFHFRSEHFLRLCKFIFRYRNEKQSIRHTLNLLFCHRSKVENFDYLNSSPSPSGPLRYRSKKLYRLLVEINYILGFLAGNSYFALKRYEDLAKQIISFCKAHNIVLLLAGPASRPHTWWEGYLTNVINRHMKRIFDISGMTYIELTGTKGINGEPLFFPNGIQVNEVGHKRIADLILSRMDFLKNYCAKQ